MKKTTLIGIFILSVAFIYAIEAGDIISQQQLDNINVTTFDLDCQFEDQGQEPFLYWRHGDLQYIRNVSCISVEPFNESYKVIRPSHYPYFLVVDYVTCRQSYSQQQCSDYFVGQMRSMHIIEKESIRDIVRGYQTPVTPDLGDFNGTLMI